MTNFLHSFIWLSFVCSLQTVTFVVQAANVLAVFPSVWKSHYLYGRRLMQQYVALHNHSVTLVSPYDSASETRLQNIREIRVPGMHDNWVEMGLTFNVEQLRQKSVMERFTRLIYAGTTNVDLLLNDAQVRKLLLSGEQYDLLVVDLFLSDALLGLAHFYKVPAVVISPSGANTWLNQMTGNPQNSALDPSIFLPYSEQMSLWERSLNTLMSIFEKLTYNFFHMISQQSIYVKHFHSLCQRNDSNELLPHHQDLTKNISVVLLNSHPVVQYPRAYLPNMVEIGGAHMSLNAADLELPRHLSNFIAEAPNGVIYVSLGANLRTADLAREKLDALLHAFATLQDMRVLLKWELEQFDYDLPPNVFLADWFPQQAVLAHENVKIFITTAGLMSLIEALYFKTPLLTLPVHPEQEVAARRMQQQGCAILLPFDALSYKDLMQAIHAIRTNLTYFENIRRLSALITSSDVFGSPTTKALQYMELVLQTGGANHLKSHANQFGFFRTELVDVLLILLAGASCIIAVPFLVTCCILRKSYHSYLNAMSSLPRAWENGAGGEALVSRRRSSTSASASSNSSSSLPGEQLSKSVSYNPKRLIGIEQSDSV